MKLDRMIRLALLTAITSFAVALGEPAKAPDIMIHMVVRLMGPDIKPNSFPALPKTIFRAGPHFARIEDPPD